MWSAFAFLSAFLRVAQTPIRKCTEPRAQPCRPFLWSQAEVAAVGHPGLLRLFFLYLKKKTKKHSTPGPRNQEQLPTFPLRFLHSVLSFFSGGSTRLFACLPIFFFPLFLAFPSLYPSRPAFSWPTPDFSIAWLENSLAFSVFRLLRSSPDSRHMNHFLFTIRQASE